MNLTPEQRATGRDNYLDAVGYTRRDFLRDVAGGTGVAAVGLGAAYFDYQGVSNPLRVGIIGTGDQGGVLIGAMNPNYIDVVAIADIRPYNLHRALHGHWATSEAARAVRPGLIQRYGWASEDQARRHVKVYDHDYHELLNDPDVEAVIVALPLHLHAEATVAALRAGKHVLCEKLMAHNVAECKVMARVAEETGRLLATGHQRHYNILYDNAVNLLKWGVLGQLHHVRAQWHRGNLPGRDSWKMPIPGGEQTFVNGEWRNVDRIYSDMRNRETRLERETDILAAENLEKELAEFRAWNADRDVDAEQYGYQAMTLPNGRVRSALEELCRWRLWHRTGGGLMAELGSHQLDAASIFISALARDKVLPLTVHAVGGRHMFPFDREVEDHVYCMYEFPGPAYDLGDAERDAREVATRQVGYYDPAHHFPNPEEGIPGYDQDPNKKIVVSYSSINGNGFGGYGEVVLGTKGTLILEQEQEVMLYKDSDTSTRVGVRSNGSGAAVLDTQASGELGAVAQAVEGSGPVSRGYTEEMEHWAWCIRNPDPANQPRCYPKVALADAVIALVSNVAIARSIEGQGGFVQFQQEWFDIHDDATPDGSSPRREFERFV